MNWIVLKSLNEIYSQGRCKKKQALTSDPDVRHLIDSTGELLDEGDEIAAGAGFEIYYVTKLLTEYNIFNQFLTENNLKKPQTRFEDKDIRILMLLKEKMDNDELAELRKQIIEANETIRGISQMYFRNEKYLDDKPSLIDALKQILDVSEFANEKDHQYMYRLECHSPKVIVLCENLDFLLKITKARRNHIELWYAGGKNVEKLEFVQTRGLPIFYSCDWDYDGMLIYRLVKDKIKSIELLYPTGTPRDIVATEHDSHWKNERFPLILNDDDRKLFGVKEIDLLRSLARSNSWIIEESNDLIQMLGEHLT